MTFYVYSVRDWISHGLTQQAELQPYIGTFPMTAAELCRIQCAMKSLLHAGLLVVSLALGVQGFVSRRNIVSARWRLPILASSCTDSSVSLSPAAESTAHTAPSSLDDMPTTTVDKNTKTTLQDHQDRAVAVTTSFIPNEFNPHPWMSNKHVQTIASAFVRGIPECNYVSNDNVVPTIQAITEHLRKLVKGNDTSDSSSTFWDVRQRIDTPDGDWFHVDWKYASGDKKGLVIILHGLQSNSNSPLSIDMGRAFHQQLQMDVACINFRGCSGIPNDTLGGYHLGFTDDLMLFLKMVTVSRQHQNVPLYLSGFSLGANVMLKALGELGPEALEKFNIQGATAFCVPMDCERNVPYMGSEGFNQYVYCRNLLTSLWTKAQQQLDTFCDGNVDTPLFDFKGVMAAKTISDFDAAYVAPIYGFDSVIDYYRNVSSVYYLDSITVPTLILNAQDDPFMDPTYFPISKSGEYGGKAPLKMVLTKHGGHLGYTFQQVSSSLLEDCQKGPSWASVELARFVHHVYNHPLMTLASRVR